MSRARLRGVLQPPSSSSLQPGEAQTLGLFTDDAASTATVFDADSGALLGSVFVPSDPLFGCFGDCAVSVDRTLAFATTFECVLWVIDLSTSPPTFAGGIPISNPGEDIALTVDGNYALVTDGGTIAEVSVVDISARAEIGTFATHDSVATSVEVCDDGAILVTSLTNVERHTIDAFGNVPDTGAYLVAWFPLPQSKASIGKRGVRRLHPTVPVSELSVSVLMWNPDVFPSNPEQWSPGLDATVWSDGSATARRHGTGNNIDLELDTFQGPGGRRYARFPFSILTWP